MGCGCVWSSVIIGMWVRVKGVLPRREWDVFRCIARVFLREVWLKDVEDLVGFRGNFIGCWVSYGG